jgi:hypothetical protein
MSQFLMLIPLGVLSMLSFPKYCILADVSDTGDNRTKVSPASLTPAEHL